MTKLSDLMDTDLLQDHIDNGIISARRDPNTGLTAIKYTAQAMMGRVWDDVTINSRGTIVDDNGNVLARGFRKFFNFSEHAEGSIDIDKPGYIMDKVDGSLGIAFKRDGDWVVSTQGSTRSEQALHATKVMNERYGDTPYTKGASLMLEIVFPDNRIVTNYDDQDDLILLAAVDMDGTWIHPDEVVYNGPKVSMKRGSIRDALDAVDPGDTSEGFVIRQDDGLMVKIKFPSYLAMHKARYSINRKSIKAVMAEGTFAEFLATLPDEFQDDAKEIHSTAHAEYSDILSRVNKFTADVEGDTKRDRALWIKANAPADISGLVMAKTMTAMTDDDLRNRILMKHMD